MLFDLLLIFTATILIWSLPPQHRDETLARLDLFRLNACHHNQSEGSELVWERVGHPDLCQWEAQGHGGISYKVWFEAEVGWRAQKIDDGIVSMEITAASEEYAKGIAVLWQDDV